MRPIINLIHFQPVELTTEILAPLFSEISERLRFLVAQVERLESAVKKASAERDVLKAEVEKLKVRLNRNSSNSSKPPSSDSLFNKKEKKKKGADENSTKPKKPRAGHGPKCLPPDDIQEIQPTCSCGCGTIIDTNATRIHQIIEIPEIHPLVTHLILNEGRCQNCGKMVKAEVPAELQSGFGPRLSALVMELTGVLGNSRRGVADFLHSAFGISVSQGGIQKILDRASAALEPYYDAIAEQVRSAPINHADETSWKVKGDLCWLWALGNADAALFLLHQNRNKAAFEALIQTWTGILVCDGYGAYQKWEHGRQLCLAHLIRDVKGLSERSDPKISGPGRWLLDGLRRLCHMAKEPPTVNDRRMLHARLQRLIHKHKDQKDDLGKLVRRISREFEHLCFFLDHPGVSPTNNHAERLLRFGVLLRKRSYGTRNEKGNRLIERLLSFRHTCRLRGIPTFPVLVDAITAFFHNTVPDLSWIKLARTPTP